MPVWSNILGMLTQPLSEAYKAKQVRSQAKETGKQKLAAARLSGTQEITLTDAEWEAISAENQESSWKDEYVTLLITYPFIGIFIGSVYQAFTGNTYMLDAVILSLETLDKVGVDLGYLMTAVVLAAIGLKVWRSK